MDGMEEIAEVKGAGGDGAVSAEELQHFLDAVGTINRDSGKYWMARLNAEATRFQKWAGQSPDGKQRAEYMGSQPFPFDGASDQRVYWADMLVSERVKLFMVAAWRAVVSCLPAGAGKAEQAWQGTQVLRWFMRQTKARLAQELTRAANYATADSPAVCVMKVWFERTRELEMRRLTAAELAELWVRLSSEGEAFETFEGLKSLREESFNAETQGRGDAESGMGGEEIQRAAMEFEAALAGSGAEMGEDRDDSLAEMIMMYFDVRPARARKAVKELRETGTCEFPVPGEWKERIRVKALRYADDFYMPDGTADWDECPFWFECEWIDKATILARAENEGWNEKFTEKLLEQEAVAGFNEYEVTGTAIELTRAELHKGFYQLITAHYRAVNEDGVAARYACAFHAAVADVTAYGRRLERNELAVFFGGETLDGWLLNARGIPERIGPASGVLKGMKDDMCDGARLSLLPPIAGEGYGTGKEETLNFEPLAYIPLKRGGSLKALSVGTYPAQTVEVLKGMMFDRDEQFHRAVEGVPQATSDTATEFEVTRWLGFVEAVYGAAMALIARNASEETLVRITDRQGRQVLPGGRGMLAGAYDVEVVFDATTLDEDRTIKKLNAVTQLKQSDAENVLAMTPFIKAGTRALFPHHADEALQQGNEGQEGEWEQERRNYLSIRAGVMPKMVDDGTWNYDQRLQFYVELMQNNPAAMDDAGEDKVEMFETWLKFLQQQATQYGENVETGKKGVKAEG